MAKSQNYTSSDIKVLTDFEHVRQRTNVYLGNTNIAQYTVPILTGTALEIEQVEFVPAAYKAVGEIIDNALDEFHQLPASHRHVLTINADPAAGTYSISDNGRGVPIDKHETGKYTPEVVFGSLRSGRNFDDTNKTVGVIGVNGVGSACTNAVSSKFDVSITRDGHIYTQTFSNGASSITTPSIKKTTKKDSGTTISFCLDDSVFKHVAIPQHMMESRAVEIAMCNPDVTVMYNNTKYHYSNGMADVIKNLIHNKTIYRFTIDSEDHCGEIFVVLDATDSIDEQMFTWINSSLLYDGGKCNTQFMNALYEKTIEVLTPKAKKTKSEVTRNDVRQGLLVFANLKLKQPEYDSQAKTRLTGPDMKREFVHCVDQNWKQFSKVASSWLDTVLERAVQRHHRTENKRAIDDHLKARGKRVEGLLDATSRIRQNCQLLLTEGESAKSSICEARDPETTAAFALTGKINNVYDCTVAQVLNMGKITSLLSAIGLTPGRRAVRSELNFGRIVIATDADVDGGDIFTLLVNLFYKFWPELFDPELEPIVYRLVSPNVVVSKNSKRVHFTTREEFDQVKQQYKGWTVEYMKGLGSLSMSDWEMILATHSAVYIPIVDDGNIKPTLTMLFNDDADARKHWLATTDSDDSI